MARLATAVLVSALIRRTEQAGGSAMVLAKGDATAGTILLILVERGENIRFFERGLGPDGEPALIASGPAVVGDDAEASAYWHRRREQDRDLWVVELDVADAERFAAETIGVG